MTHDVYGNLRQEMKAMKEERGRRIPELKAEAHQIKAQARQFMNDKHAENAELQAQARGVLTQARHFMAEKHAEIAGLKAEVARTLGEFTQASRDRAASWKQTLNAVRGHKPGRAHASGRRG